MPKVWWVGLAGLVTALATGLGALPFLFVPTVSKRAGALANAAAAGLMLGASFGLISEGSGVGPIQVIIGGGLGLLFIAATDRFLGHGHNHGDESASKTTRKGARRMLWVLVIMTAHSFAEGVAVGVSFGSERELAILITCAIAVHNVPEGVAITAVMRPKGHGLLRCAGWSIVSSLPQPLMAVPAFWFVESFRPVLPYGLGFAAGAMVFLVFWEILPEAYEEARTEEVAALVCVALAAMVLFQELL